MFVYSCVRSSVTALRTRSVRPGPVTGDLDLCSLWTQYDDNSKTDTRNDPYISTGSCNEDQTTIRTQNCVISGEYLSIGLF